MPQILSHFIFMGGYGIYIWPAYSSVLAALFIQWQFTSRKSKRTQIKSSHE